MEKIDREAAEQVVRLYFSGMPFQDAVTHVHLLRCKASDL